MDGDLGNKVREVLNDPDMMQKLTALAAQLGAGEEGGNDGGHDESNAAPDPVPSPPAAPHNDRDRARLLSALLPYLSEERRSAAKAMLRVLRLWELIDLGSLFGG